MIRPRGGNLAALTADEQYRTRTNAISMRYASPEDLEHDHEVGLASDIYSLGATLLPSRPACWGRAMPSASLNC